jgi:hypothetical protein
MNVLNESFISFQPPSNNLVLYPVIRETDGERESSYLGLKMVIKPYHFPNGRLKIRCSATIHDIYYQSTEKSVEEERPRGLLHGTGTGVQYIHPPQSPATDLPPSGHRFEPDTTIQQGKFHDPGLFVCGFRDASVSMAGVGSYLHSEIASGYF